MGGNVKRECLYCGKSFSVYHSAAEDGLGKFCSKVCSYKSKIDRIYAICQTCGKQFETFPSAIRRGGGKYCSVACRAKAQDAHIDRVCEQCGKHFRARRGEAEQGRARYCGDKCRSLAHRKKIAFVCVECGKRVEVPECRDGMKFCSFECLQRWRRRESHVTRVCLRCGETFDIMTYRLAEGKGKFCCHKCYLEYKGETSIERLIREELDQHPEVAYQQEVRIGRYRVDFLLPTCKIVIECDGKYWHGLLNVFSRDRRKDQFLKEQGYRVFRFNEREIRKSPSTCVNRVLMAINH